MSYFEQTDPAPERAGKVIGDVMAILVIGFIVGLLVVRFI